MGVAYWLRQDATPTPTPNPNPNQVDDPPLGWARYAYTHRSTAWNSGLWSVPYP